MIRLPGRVEERGGDVLRLEERIVAQNLLVGGAGGEELEQIHHPKAGAADARTPTAFPGFDGDAFEWVHGGRLLRTPWFFQQGFQLAPPRGDLSGLVRRAEV